jgi:hypothetical protein
MNNPDSAFDDTEQLGQLLKDTKGGDKKRFSTIADARSLVEEFRSRTAESAWPSLDRSNVADRLLELIGPESGDDSSTSDVAGRAMQQGSMNLCGPAAFFHLVIKRDPLMFATYATQLFDFGTASLGTLQVVPGDDIVKADYSSFLPRMTNGICPQADWMALGALRNSTNAFFTGSFHGDPTQELSAGTTPAELAHWLVQTGLYLSVKNQANWMQSVGIPHAEGLSLSEGVDVLPLINANLINKARNLPSDTNWPLTEFPNHWVVLIGEVMKDVTKDAVFFNIWTWGRKEILDVPLSAFVQNYYGELIATMRP